MKENKSNFKKKPTKNAKHHPKTKKKKKKKPNPNQTTPKLPQIKNIQTKEKTNKN